MDSRLKEKAETVREYTQAVAAKLALQADFKAETVTVDEVEQAVKFENGKAPPKIADLIKAIINGTHPVNLSGENGQYHKTVGIVTASGIDVITIKQTDKPGEYDVIIEKQTRQKDPQGNITLESVKQPTFHMVMNPETKELSVSVGDRVVLKETDPTPRELQRKVIEQYAQAVIDGNPSQLAVMGTGTGKSWVQSGFTRAIGSGVYIVPDESLAKETEKEAIDPINKGNSNYKVVHADKLTVDQVKEHVERINKGENIHLIMRANDPQFAEKAAVIKGQFVMMDESHQHTFTDQGVKTLEALRQNNAMLALTGTPTGKLFNMFGQPMADINVAQVMSFGGLRRIDPAMTAEKPNENLVEQLVTRYLGNDSYLKAKDKGYMSIEGAKKAHPGISDQDALNMAIEHNRLRQAEQKNFAFSTNKWYRLEIADAYNNMNKNPQMRDKLSVEVMNMRRESEINARVQLLMEQDPKRNEAQVRQQVENSMRFKKVDLGKEMQTSQQKQIAVTANAEAIALFFGGKSSDFEMSQRLGELGKYFSGMTDPKDATKAQTLAKAMNMSEADIRKGLESKYPGLPPEQRKEYIELLVKTALNLQAAMKANPTNSQEWSKGMAKPEDINLAALKAKQAEIVQLSDPKASDAQKKQDSAQRAAALDGLRTGLTMQLVSDQVFATGISIPSVLSTQQLVASKADMDPIYIAQLHGRNIRANDLTAVNDQIVSRNIKKEDLLTVADIIAPDSGKRLQNMYAHIETAEARQKTVVEEKRAQFTPQEETPRSQSAPGKR